MCHLKYFLLVFFVNDSCKTAVANRIDGDETVRFLARLYIQFRTFTNTDKHIKLKETVFVINLFSVGLRYMFSSHILATMLSTYQHVVL